MAEVQVSGQMLSQNDDDHWADAMSPSEREWLELVEAEPLLLALAASRKPLVAALHGRVSAVGLSLLVRCDLVYVADDAQILCSPAILSSAPETPALLAARTGYLRAFELLTLGKLLDGRAAHEWGLANEAFPLGELHARARASARSVLKAAPAVARAVRACAPPPVERHPNPPLTKH